MGFPEGTRGGGVGSTLIFEKRAWTAGWVGLCNRVPDSMYGIESSSSVNLYSMLSSSSFSYYQE